MECSLIFSGLCCLRGNAWVVSGYLLFATIAPESFIFFHILSSLPLISSQVFLTLLDKEDTCAGIPPIYLAVKETSNVIVFLFYTW